MSEYWKSTPSYWCKHCKTYVRDTKLEKANHEATPRHQGNLKRFLRDLHRGHEKEQREKDRAKDEVARLNGLVSGSGAVGSSSSSSQATYPAPKPQATPSQRKQQLAQLAEMGVSIPDEFRPDMAMAGEWQVTSERIVDDESEKKPDALALGVRKREPEDDDEEAMEARKRRWGTAIRTYPTEREDVDLDALLNNATRKGKGPAMKSEADADVKPEIKTEPGAAASDSGQIDDSKNAVQAPVIKKEPSLDETLTLPNDIPAADVKQEADESTATGVVFKKRKAKNIRQK